MKLLVVHGGGPTAVMNCSLYGVVTAAKERGSVEVYGARQGFAGILMEDFMCLTDISDEKLARLLQTPGSVIGSSRDVVSEADYEAAVEVLHKHSFDAVLFNGGNGTMDTAGKLNRASNGRIHVVGIPKTVDNDLAVVDHAPGFASAANFIAHMTHEIAEDVRSMPIHVSIIEVMGRNAGWLTAAAGLAKTSEDSAPHLLYFPEVPFDEQKFIEDVKKQLAKSSGVVVVVSEGLKNAAGDPIVQPIMKTDRAVYFGDVGTHLAQLVLRDIGYKARSEKVGLLTRASVRYMSDVDRQEAIAVGARALQAAIEGENGVMVSICRVEGTNGGAYDVTYPLIPIDQVMLDEKGLPEHFMNAEKNGVSEAFIEWCKPLIDEQLTQFFNE